MGRRSISTTKSGKYMNPTDQARKEARKKELKKNKKQRQMVRAAVLKGKDPLQLLVEMEKIDQMEFNPLQPSPLNEKVLKDKRRKLKETLDRVMKMYNRDEPEKWVELKRAQVEYDRKRTALINYFDAVKNAQDVQLEEIPLPLGSLAPDKAPSQIPLPIRPPPGILKKTSSYNNKRRNPPGVPPGPPPDLEEFDPDIKTTEGHGVSVAPPKKSIRFADDLGREVDETAKNQLTPEALQTLLAHTDGGLTAWEMGEDTGSKPTSLQQKLLAMSGQNVDEFIKEMEEVNKKRKAEKAADLDARLALLGERSENEKSQEMRPGTRPPMMPAPPGTEMLPPPHTMPGLPPMMFRPPPRGVPSLMGIRLPPGPPPGLPPRMGMRLPPGPPPGLPPRMMRPPGMPGMMGPPPQTNTVSAGPQLISRPDTSGATIQAQAKIRNLSADVTRFLPSSLRVKRDDKGKIKLRPVIREPHVEIRQPIIKHGQTKDDAYQQFMREMEGLL